MADEELEPRARRRLARRNAAEWLRLVVIAIVAIYGILFIGFNTHETKVNFVFGSTRVSVIWVILLSIALGLVLGVLLRQLRRHRRARER